MRDRISISKSKIDELYKRINIDNEFKEAEYEYYMILVSTISFMGSTNLIFKKNIDFYEFLKKVFNIEYKGYIVKNKSLLLGKIIRYISTEINKKDYEKYANRLNREINEIIDPQEEGYVKFLQGIKK